ncbi:hypothetical protein evm_001933 [Chilo suppressalis]|nr:hypothetical protein evm_001933 [Chilo suppressalis]
MSPTIWLWYQKVSSTKLVNQVADGDAVIGLQWIGLLFLFTQKCDLLNRTNNINVKVCVFVCLFLNHNKSAKILCS